MKHSANNKLWNCDKCEVECSEDRQKPLPGFKFHPDLPSTEINVCPVAYMRYKMDPYCLFLFELYAEFKRYGTLHFPGPLNDQPWWMINGFNIIQNAINYVEDLEDRKTKKGGRTMTANRA